MDCPLCQKAMKELHVHVVRSGPDFEGRHYTTYQCALGTNLCNGLLVKVDRDDQKSTFITPCHSMHTLSHAYIESVSSLDLVRSILSVFEWEMYKKLIVEENQ